MEKIKSPRAETFLESGAESVYFPGILSEPRMIPEISAADFKAAYLSDPSRFEIIDVREPFEFDQVRIKGSKLLPLSSFVSKIGEIDWSKEVVFVCRTGGRSAQVTSALQDAGYEGKNLSGGIHILSMNCQECLESGSMDPKYFER